MSAGAVLVILRMGRHRAPDPKLPWWGWLLVIGGSLALGGIAGLAIWFLLAG